MAFILVTLCALGALLLPKAFNELRLRKRARHDYRIARGTQHLRQLQSSLSHLRSEIYTLQKEIGNTQQRLADLERKRSKELRTSLCQYLVHTRLTEVKGIGPQLSARIAHRCFRSDLRDLRYAQQVAGVGPTRQRAINRWVQEREREMPRLLAAAFPGKSNIEKKYEDREQALKKKLVAARSDLEERQALYQTGRAAADQLQSVRMPHFRKALKANTSDPIVPNWYFEGIYPAWEPAPEWFKTLLGTYGG
jgi:hypothetical protein